MTKVPTPKQQSRAVRVEEIAAEIKRQLGDQLISVIYRDRVRATRTRSYRLDAPAKKTDVEVMHTLLGVELKIGKRRLLCPDLAMARYLSVFADSAWPKSRRLTTSRRSRGWPTIWNLRGTGC